MKTRILVFFVFLYGISAWAQVQIIGFWGIPPEMTSVERYREMHDCGFDVGISIFNNMQEIDKAMNCANQVGMKLIPWCPAVEKDVRKNVEKLRSYPAFYAYCIGDEPTMKKLKNFKDRLNVIKDVDTSFPFYINLAPSYGTETLEWLGVSNYSSYIHAACVDLQLPYLSFDYYPVIKGRFGIKLRPNWFSCLEAIRRESLKMQIPFWTFVLSTPHSVYPRPTLASLRLQIYSSLAYGAQAIQYFTYWTPQGDSKNSYSEAMISKQGKRTELYYLVKKMNEELHGFSSLFTEGKVVKVGHVGNNPDSSNPFTDYPSIFSQINVETVDGAIVSLLEVGNAKYIMWVNTSLTKEIRIKNMPVSSRTVFRINKKLKKETLQSEYKLTEGDILILQYQ